MLKMNLDTSIDNIGYLQYMQEQEEKLKREKNSSRRGSEAPHTQFESEDPNLPKK